MNTIPEIAEALRHHINTDNDAKRLICEHVLPLVGIHGATPQEVVGITEARDTAESLLAEAVKRLDRAVWNYETDDNVPAGLIEELKHIIGLIDV
jgi:hypothetical protein